MEDLLILFGQEDREICLKVFDSGLDSLCLGATSFQIRHFVLNRREFPNDFAQFQQIKLELFSRWNTLFDLQYQYRKAEAEIMLYEAEIEELKLQTKGKISNAQIALKQIEIDKNIFQLASIKKQASDRLREALVFYKEYQSLLPKIENMNQEQIAKAEEESWKIKSAYYPELLERYGLTPNGFLKLPHENGGLKELINIQNRGLKEGK